MKPRTFILCLLFLALPIVANAGPLGRWINRQQPAEETKEQQVDLSEAPEDGDRPWRILFTSENWQQDELETLAVYTLEQLGDQDGQVRPQHITPRNPLFQQYEGLHLNDLPCIVVLVPGEGDSIASIPTNIHGSTIPLTSEGIIKEISLSADEVKGRIGNPHEPPFWIGWNRRRHRNGWCPTCNGYHPGLQPQPQLQPPPRITRLPRVGDTVIGKRLEKLEALAKKLEDPAKAVAKGLGINAAVPLSLAGLLGVLGGVIGGIRKRAGGFLEEEEE